MSTNITKEKRDDLIKKVNAIKDHINSSPIDENTNALLTYLADIENELRSKKFGLVFEEHREWIDEKLENNLPVLEEETDLFVNNGGEMNFLIEGDNLASLNLLLKTHKGKIDLIYIDPPYNTGNKDFIYDDNFVDSTDSFRHSKWLSFMEKRLKLARKLLSDNGAIFISIDDNEQAELKLLCDSVFGEDKFVANIIWRRKRGKDNSTTSFSKLHEYLLVISRNNAFYPKRLPMEAERKSKYTNPDNDPKGAYVLQPAWASGMKKGPTYEVVIGKYNFSERMWLYSKETLLKAYNENRLSIKGTHKDGNPNVYLKVYLSENKGIIPDTIWDTVGNTGDAVEELKSLFGNIPFDTPKPLNYIKQIIRTGSDKTSTILDFFAGSGTTGHAVMKLNAEDGGKRKFILCTNNENDIARDVTYERIKRVIAKENYKASLKYFKVKFLPISDQLYYEYADELLEHIRELVELENAIYFKSNAEFAIILTDEELETFVKNIPTECKKVYLGHNVLLTEDAEIEFTKRNIAINIIPEYYYTEEAF